MYLYLVWNKDPLLLLLLLLLVTFFITLVVDYYISGWYMHEPKDQTARTYPGFLSMKHA